MLDFKYQSKNIKDLRAKRDRRFWSSKSYKEGTIHFNLLLDYCSDKSMHNSYYCFTQDETQNGHREESKENSK